MAILSTVDKVIVMADGRFKETLTGSGITALAEKPEVFA
jgi:hypothetical protein